MRIKGVLVRFVLVYFALLLITVLASAHFQIDPPIGLLYSILGGTVIGVCWAFAQKNRRWFTSKEKIRVVIGMIIIDLAWQTITVLGAVVSGIEVGADKLLAFLVIYCLINLTIIYLAVGLTKKLLIKQGIIDGQQALSAGPQG